MYWLKYSSNPTEAESYPILDLESSTRIVLCHLLHLLLKLHMLWRMFFCFFLQRRLLPMPKGIPLNSDNC
jgi:hypothetical protein